MGFWTRLFGLEQEAKGTKTFSDKTPPPQPSASPHYAPGTRIAYDDHLIERLLADHRKLLALFTATRNAFVAGDTAHTTENLDQFKKEIQAHLLTEEIRLYVYLENALANNDFNHTMMRNMHKEMASIGHDVLGFLDKYNALGKNHALSSSFIADLDQLGKVLIERIQQEESTLYPLYIAPAELGKAHVE
ncbi:MAG: hemerythrin domain-containing protein [Methylobacillus sp.]|jgi:regulator of sigma D|nr:hemerythrin domain-containing protein [Methylobacillus sp.]